MKTLRLRSSDGWSNWPQVTQLIQGQNWVFTSKPTHFISSPPESTWNKLLGSKLTFTNINLTLQDSWPSKEDKIMFVKLCFLNRKGDLIPNDKILNKGRNEKELLVAQRVEQIKVCTTHCKSKLITFLLHIVHGELGHNFYMCLSVLFPNGSS